MPTDTPISRRNLLYFAGVLSFGCGARSAPVPPSEEVAGSTLAVQARLRELERRVGGRLGIAAIDTARGRGVRYRADERFPMCSTFKLPLAGAVLRRVDAGREDLGRLVRYDESALLEHAPVAAQRVTQGMTIEELCAASVMQSDNTAANLLLESLGGPSALTAFFRSLGDQHSRLDRNEPSLNTAIEGDERDSTTPSAMLGTMRVLLLESELTAASKARLIEWLVATTTGRERLRAGLPRDYRVGDKTGTGEHGATNDLAIAWPPGRAPLLIAAYSVGSTASLAERSAALAQAARIVNGAIG
jgi:beta-lactamase class A